jgi:LysM repeat protein
MNIFRELAAGIIIALISIMVIAGIFSLSYVESKPISLITNTEEPYTNPPLNVSPEYSPSTSPTVALHQATRTSTPTSLPSPTVCPPPEGWLPYVVQSGDSIETLAQVFSTSGDQLKLANCLISNSLIPDSIIYVPPSAVVSSTPELPPTPIPCSLPTGWEEYIVQPSDTIRDLAMTKGVNRSELLAVNCLDNGAVIHVGDIIYVPSEPIFTQHTPTSTPTVPENTPTSNPKETNTPAGTGSVIP